MSFVNIIVMDVCVAALLFGEQKIIESCVVVVCVCVSIRSHQFETWARIDCDPRRCCREAAGGVSESRRTAGGNCVGFDRGIGFFAANGFGTATGPLTFSFCML